jgi:hypothetical protein
VNDEAARGRPRRLDGHGPVEPSSGTKESGMDAAWTSWQSCAAQSRHKQHSHGSASMWMFSWFCTHEIDTTPPATITSHSPAAIRAAETLIACSPDAQNRLTVMPGTDSGSSARMPI